MTGFLIGLLTFVMVVDCAILVALVLIQLPKKDTGGGLAFGGGATDALFGAGSGTVLTKVTKYAAAIFFVLAVILSVMQRNYHHPDTSEFDKRILQQGKGPPMTMPAATPASAPATTPTTPAATPTASTPTNIQLTLPPKLEATNLPAGTPTSPASAPTPSPPVAPAPKP